MSSYCPVCGVFSSADGRALERHVEECLDAADHRMARDLALSESVQAGTAPVVASSKPLIDLTDFHVVPSAPPADAPARVPLSSSRAPPKSTVSVMVRRARAEKKTKKTDFFFFFSFAGL